MRELGGIGAVCVGTEAEGGNGLGLSAQIDVIRAVGGECGATAFSVWCQSACAWYLHQSENEAVRTRYLADVLQRKVLAGTAMSNTVKHLADIEKHLLQAEKVAGGYVVSGFTAVGVEYRRRSCVGGHCANRRRLCDVYHRRAR